jgi:PHD/YefM family antitoxin component YafN of YafNO toxin-antitoxin module
MKMHTITFNQASKDLGGVIKKTIDDKDETIISTDDGAVVILDEGEWSHMKETLRLLSDKDALTSLLESHAIRAKGKRPAGINFEKAFADV